VKDVCEPAVRLDESRPVRDRGERRLLVDEAQWESAIAHLTESICVCSRSGAPISRTDTQQSEDGGGTNPPVEGFLPTGNGHTDPMAPTKATGSAADFLPPTRSLEALREAAAGCKGCSLWKLGTQTVFGEGSDSAEIMFVGEQPGDQEDRAGRPFVGPAGQLFDKALAAAGIDRSLTYTTNAVKHFKWKARGKRRIHQKPNWSEMTACRPWLEAELEAVEPRVLVLLGATAAQSLLGRQFRVTQNRGTLLDSDLAEAVTATIHPSAILRGDPEQRERELGAFVDDLRFARSLL